MVAVALIICLLAAAVAVGANERAVRYEWLVSRAVMYGDESLGAEESTGLIADWAGQPSVCTESPGYVLATLEQNASIENGERVLEAILSAQDTGHSSRTRGQFPWRAGEDSTPSLEATYFAAPVLAQIHLRYGDGLPPQLQENLATSLHLALDAVKRNAAPSQDEVTGLLRAAALSMLGRAVGDEEALAAASQRVVRWFTDYMAKGLGGGHSPRSDSYRLAALKWIWQATEAEARDLALESVLGLMYRDLAYRVQPDSGALAGAALFAERADYLRGGQYSRYLVYADLGGPPPASVTPFAMFFTASGYEPAESLRTGAARTMPYQVSTAARGQGYVTRTDTYMHPLLSLGTMSGQPSATTIPLLVTFAQASSRPTVYFFTSPQASHVSSIQVENVGLVTVDFDLIGQGNRRTAMLEGVLGTRAQIGQVFLGRSEWPGLPAAVPEMGIVAVERSGCYVGVRLLRAGPVEGEQLVSGPRPGVLAWSSEGDSAELQLRIYGRKRTYGLRKPIHNVRAGVVVEVVPASDFDSLAAFAAYFARARPRQRIERAKELLPKSIDPFEAVLTEHDPKTKADLHYRHMLMHTVTYQTKDLVMEIQEDMLAEQVVYRQVNGEPIVARGPWQVGDEVVEWAGE